MTDVFDAHGFRFRAGSPDQDVTNYLNRAFSGLRAEREDTGGAEYVLSDAPYRLDLDGEPIGTGTEPGDLLDVLCWDVNRRAVTAAAPTHLVLHAAAVGHGDAVVLMPAASGSGKSTLAAALVIAGFGYVSDEAPALDLATGTIRAFPKPLALEPASVDALRAITPITDDELPSAWRPTKSLLSPAQLGGSILRAGCLGSVVAPRYEAGAMARLDRLSTAEAVLLVARHAFNLRQHGQAALDVLARCLRRVVCYRLTYSDLGDAVAAVTDVVGRPPEVRSIT